MKVTKPPPASDFTKADMKRLRTCWEKWKADNSTESDVLRDALDELLNVHGYSLTDIGVFLGLSRERIRQYVKQFGIEVFVKGPQFRMWDDDENRFVAMPSKAVYDKEVTAKYGANAMARKAHAKRRRVAVWVLRDIGASIGRVPAHADLADAYDMEAGRMNGVLGFTTYRGSIGDQCRELWAEAGFEYLNYAENGRGRPELEHKPLRHSIQVQGP